MLHAYFFFLFCMNLCICRVFLFFELVSEFKILSGIVQLEIGDATMWYESLVFNTKPRWVDLVEC
jgi:hypothetical protein